MIWLWCAKWYVLIRFFQDMYHIEIWKYLGSVSLKDIISTHMSIRSVLLTKLFIKLKHLIWFIIEYVYLYQQHTPSCTWMSRTTPPWSSAPGTRVRSSPGSPVQWCRHSCTWLFVQWSDQPQICYQMKAFDVNHYFRVLLQKYFYTFYKSIFLEIEKFKLL